LERFGNDASRLIWEGRPNKATRRLVPSPLHAKTAARMDTILNTATLKECSSFPPGWHFKVLHGKQRGVFQVRLDDRYRIRFRWDEQYGAVDVTAGEFHDEDD